MIMKRGQVWIETVVYTLIGLSLIGLVLGFVTPKIMEYRDRAVIEQTISSLNLVDSKVNEVLRAPGNTRIVDLQLKRGAIYVDSDKNKIYFEIEDSRVLYSQLGEETNIGRIKVLTVENKNKNDVKLTVDYGSSVDFEGTGVKKISASATPYKISISHQGFTPPNGQGLTTPIIKIEAL